MSLNLVVNLEKSKVGGKREEVEFNIFRACLLFDLNRHGFLNYDSSNLSYYNCSLLYNV